MFYFLVVWTGLLGVCLVTGCGELHLLGAGAIARPAERFILSVWLGLSSLAIGSLAATLVVPLSPGVGAGLALLAMLPALVSPLARAELISWWQKGYSRWHFAGYALSGIAIAAFMTQEVDWIDTGAYHYGLIRWFAEYGITPGLVLLNRQFGFMSAWFALAAPFNPSSNFVGIDGRASNVMNGFALLLAAVQMAIASRCILTTAVASTKSRLNSWFLLIFSLVVCAFLTQTPLLSRITASASPDIAIALFSVAVPWSMLVVDTTERSQQAPLNISFIPVILAAAAFSIKLTALPLLPIALGFYLFRSVTLTHWTKGILLTLVLVLPFLITQTIISGYPLYPSTALHFNFPWTRAIADVQDLAANTHGWAQWFGQPPPEANRFLWLFKQWLGSTHTSKLMAALIVCSFCSSLYLLALPRTRNNYGFIWLQLLSAIGITFMMLKAPLFRLGMGYTLVLPMLSVAMMCDFIFNRTFKKRLKATAKFRSLNRLIVLASLLSAAIINVSSYSVAYHHIVFARPLPIPVLKKKQINGVAYTVTQDNEKQCWSAQLPCVADLPLHVRLRNPSAGLKGGFIYDSTAELQ